MSQVDRRSFQEVPSHALLYFLLLTLAITWGIAGAFIFFPEQAAGLLGELEGAHPLYFVATWGPGLAGFIGSPAMNFVRGRVRNGAIEVPAFDETIHPDITMPAEGTDVIVGLRPEHALLDPSGEAFTVELTEALSVISYAYLTSPTGETLIFEERGDNRSKVGDTVSLSYEKRRIYVFDAETEKRIR